LLSSAAAAPAYQEGTLRALAVTSAKRSGYSRCPDMAESGVPDQESELIIGVLVPRDAEAHRRLLQRQIADRRIAGRERAAGRSASRGAALPSLRGADQGRHRNLEQGRARGNIKIE